MLSTLISVPHTHNAVREKQAHGLSNKCQSLRFSITGFEGQTRLLLYDSIPFTNHNFTNVFAPRFAKKNNLKKREEVGKIRRSILN